MLCTTAINRESHSVNWYSTALVRLNLELCMSYSSLVWNMAKGHYAEYSKWFLEDFGDIRKFFVPSDLEVGPLEV